MQKQIKIILALAPTFLMLTTLLSAQNMSAYSIAHIPIPLLANANEVVREDVQSFEVKSLKEGELHVKKVVTLLNESSNANELVIHYNYKESKVSKVKARIYDATGNLVRKVNDKETQDFSNVSSSSIDDSRVKTLDLIHNDYPYTVEYEYDLTMEGIRFAQYPNWFIQHYRQAVQHGTFSISIPVDQELYFRALNIDIEPNILGEGSQRVYTWKVKDLPAIKAEHYGPYHSKVLPMIITSPDRFQFGSYKGSMASWEAYSSFIHQLYAGKDKLPDDVKAEVHALTKDAKTKKEKINILYQYMQENMRYVSVQLGLSGWEPFDAEYVSRNKYGDCKALTNFMKSMLKEVGITSYPALIESGDITYELTDSFATNWFDHVILNVPSENYWLECTSTCFPPNYIGSNNQDRNVLLVAEKGGRLVKTPSLNHRNNFEQNNAKIFIDTEGKAKIKNTVLLTGSKQELYRELAKNYGQEKSEEWFTQNNDLPSFKLEKLEINAFDDRPACEMTYEGEIARYGSKAGRRFFLPINVVNASSAIPDEAEERTLPIMIKRAFTEQDSITIHLPEGYKVESLPESETTVTSDFGEYKVQIVEKEGVLTLHRSLQIQSMELPAEAYDDFRSFYKEVAKMDDRKMVLVKKRT